MKKHVQSQKDTPRDPHWAVFKFSSVHVPGDERSRTHPGHGYPAHSVSVVNYEAYHDEDEWKAEIARLEERRWGREAYFAARVIPAKVELSVDVEVHTEE